MLKRLQFLTILFPYKKWFSCQYPLINYLVLNQEYIPEKRRFMQPMVVMACILIGVTIVAIIIFLLESVYGARVDLRKEKRKPGNILAYLVALSI